VNDNFHHDANNGEIRNLLRIIPVNLFSKLGTRVVGERKNFVVNGKVLFMMYRK
jgi:hypothetical protein